MGGDEDMSFACCLRGLFFLFFGLCLLAHSFSREKREMMRRVASKVRDRYTWTNRERETLGGEREKGKGSVPNGE